MTTKTGRVLLSAILACAATPAFAHHPLAGAPMETLWHGLLSGFGHPILGFDHLFFIVAAGIAATFTARPVATAAGFVAAICAGVALAHAGLPVPFAELGIMLSLVTVGGLLAFGRPVVPLVLAGFGLFHGAAFAEALAGQEMVSWSVLVGYLAGLAVMQSAIAVAAGRIVVGALNGGHAVTIQARLAGSAVAGMGTLLLLELAEGYVFRALGL